MILHLVSRAIEEFFAITLSIIDFFRWLFLGDDDEPR